MKRNRNSIIAAVSFATLVCGLVMMLATSGRGGESHARMEDLPLLVRDIDNPTRQPFQEEVKVTVPVGLTSQTGTILVPTGKLMVIEHVTARGTTPAGQNVLYSITNHVVPDLTLRKHVFPATQQTFGASTTYIVSESLRLYADSPSIGVRIDRDGTAGSISATFIVSGYFVDKQF